VRLHTLELEGNHGDGIAFYKCIPNLVSLRKLKLSPHQWEPEEFKWDWYHYRTVRGLRENGSIVDVETEKGDDCGFTATQLRLIKAYCQRNRLLNELLESEHGLVDFDDGTMGEQDVAAAVVDNIEVLGVSDFKAADDNDNCSATTSKAVNDHNTVQAGLLIRPSLLQCAEQTPLSHTTMLIRSLAVLGERIGDELDHSTHSM
jgi:hypothetical protein